MKTLYKLYTVFNRKKLGSSGFMPLPAFIKNIFNRYPMQKRVVAYTLILEGQKAWEGVPQELACANAVSGILEMIDPSFFGPPNVVNRIDSTIVLGNEMERSKRFLNLTGKKPFDGCIVMNRTIGKNIGHTGIYVRGRIYNNNSATGQWLPTYTWLTWQNHFTNRKGLKTELYFPLSN